jgi:hypothetical protein
MAPNTPSTERLRDQPPPIFTSDLPQYVPEAWRIAGIDIVHRSRLGSDSVVRILRDQRLRGFWERFDSLVLGFHESGALAGSREEWQKRARRHVLSILAAKGGGRRKRTVATIKRRRGEIAAAIEHLLKLMEKDEHVKSIRVDDTLFWAALFDAEVARRKGLVRNSEEFGQTLRNYVGRDDDSTSELGLKIVTDANRPFYLAQALTVVSHRLRSGKKLAWADDSMQEPPVAPGRDDRTYLEHVLVHQLHYLAPLPGKLFAPAIEVALDLPRGSIEAEKLNERLRKIYAPPRIKTSAGTAKT